MRTTPRRMTMTVTRAMRGGDVIEFEDNDKGTEVNTKRIMR